MREDYLIPGEEIKWTGPKVNYGGEDFDIFITNKRLVLYRKKGLLSKKEDVIAEKIKNISNISLRQEGIVNKRGVLTIELPQRKFQLKGSVDAIKIVYQNIMMFWEND